MSRKLDTYLRTYRLKAGLTQKDVAFLLSLESASIVSKTEKCCRVPTLPILLAYCIIFKARPEDLVPGLLHDIENAVLTRARVLGEELKRQKATPLVVQRIKFLRSLSSSPDDAH